MHLQISWAYFLQANLLLPAIPFVLFLLVLTSPLECLVEAKSFRANQLRFEISALCVPGHCERGSSLSLCFLICELVESQRLGLRVRVL